MPVQKCGNGKWRIGNGPCVYATRDAAERAWRAVLAQREREKKQK